MVNVIGLGYIGLPTALMLSTHGVEVVGTDYNSKIVVDLNSPNPKAFKEDGISELLSDAIRKGIVFTEKYQKTNVYIVSVPTPYDKDTKKIDPSFVINAVKEVLNVCEDNSIIVIESTISPGTIDKFIRPITDEKNKETGLTIHLVHAPERIIPGNMIYELIHNDRTIGADDKEIGEIVKNLYASFCKGEIIITDIKTAEMTKVVENTYRAVNIAFANELAKICRSDGMDVYEIIKICNMHPRVNILQPGPGVGGHCISIDPWFLVGDYPELTKVIGNSTEVNASMPDYVFERLMKIVKENNVDLSRIGVYGLTYKENVDDTRESPTLQLFERFKDKGIISPKVFDPMVELDIVENQYHDFDKFLKDVDLVLIMVKHNHLKYNVSLLKNKVVYDTCNICDLKGTYKL